MKFEIGAYGPQLPRDEHGRQRKELAGTEEAQRPREEAVGGADARRRAVFVAEPLERGFGMTLGNSLRRVLLSLAPGRRDHLDQDRRRAA